MSFPSKPKIVVSGVAAFAMLAPYKIPTELSEKPAYFTRCAAGLLNKRAAVYFVA